MLSIGRKCCAPAPHPLTLASLGVPNMSLGVRTGKPTQTPSIVPRNRYATLNLHDHARPHAPEEDRNEEGTGASDEGLSSRADTTLRSVW